MKSKEKILIVFLIIILVIALIVFARIKKNKNTESISPDKNSSEINQEETEKVVKQKIIKDKTYEGLLFTGIALSENDEKETFITANVKNTNKTKIEQKELTVILYAEDEVELGKILVVVNGLEPNEATIVKSSVKDANYLDKVKDIKIVKKVEQPKE